MIILRTDGNVPEATCRDSLLMTQVRPNQAIFFELEAVYAKDVISLQLVEKWTAALGGERTEFIDLPRAGRFRGLGKVDTVGE
jgi:hypothetical protein